MVITASGLLLRLRLLAMTLPSVIASKAKQSMVSELSTASWIHGKHSVWFASSPSAPRNDGFWRAAPGNDGVGAAPRNNGKGTPPSNDEFGKARNALVRLMHNKKKKLWP